MKKRLAAGITITYALMLVTVSKASISNPPPMTHIKSKTEVHKKLYKYIGDDYISECISKSKYPYLIAAIGKVESNYAPQAIGDGGKSHGLFQIQPRIWRGYDNRVQHQVDACERIIGHLVTKHGLERGVQAYNGRGKAARQYSKRVITLARRIENG